MAAVPICLVLSCFAELPGLLLKEHGLKNKVTKPGKVFQPGKLSRHCERVQRGSRSNWGKCEKWDLCKKVRRAGSQRKGEN